MSERPTWGQIVGRNIYELRESKLLSRVDLAERSGISWASINNVEHGMVKNPRRSTIEPIAKALGVTVEDLTNEDLFSPKDLAPSDRAPSRDSSIWHPDGATEAVEGPMEVRTFAILRRVERGELTAEEAERILQAK